MTPEIKQRLEQIRRGEVPDGYKRTKAGIIPYDWNEDSVGNCVREYKRLSNDIASIPVYSSSRKGLIPQSEYYDQKEAAETNLGYKVVPQGYVTYRHMSDDDIFHFNINQTNGEILVSSEYPVFTSSKNCDLGFLVPVLNEMSRFRYFCRTQKLGGTRTRLYFHNLAKYRLGLPPLEEQRKIADILSAQDSVIGLKERLVAEKERQKKYLMQRLLTGKQRLSGFTRKWEEKRLGDIFDTFSGGTPNRKCPEYFHGDIPWIKSGELNQGNIYFTEERITKEGLENSSAKMVSKNTLLIAMYGATAGVMAFTRIDAAINQAILAFVPKTPVDILFIKESISNQIDMAINQLTQGGQPNFNASIIQSLSIRIPELAEQRKISEIFSCANREIELLRASLEQEKRKKKALSQLLLMGIVRV